jgi:predicted AlkP superfamily pyrophosphatase or phosphodiesterase
LRIINLTIKKIKEVDGIIGYLLDSLESNNLLSNMNLVLVSDHGMAKAVSKPFVIQDYVDQNLIDFNRTILNYVSNIYPKNMSQLSQLYEALHNLPNTTIYYKKDVPAEFHFSNSDRIGLFLFWTRIVDKDIA